ncbi:molybdenum cofactor guanylyltransferase [Pseudomarimonas arenosa]|uniref:Molybdenum cofactor guanylyltransferase n=1 Tax=Pseudomarimonas arenosa TaxID=2774145 RepID=A0AAW3ZQU1_9GAMM|nr:molybdenum cofactor guanylyltransferase [Pseudomarimonas arenosa]MBD8527447.1 molybdenum cofactor guanylyltransferase [Pseudomarimonas arenosa]
MFTGKWNALILAGGRSSRMGRDKAMLDWHGQPLLAAQVRHMKAFGATELRVSGDYPEFLGIPDRQKGLGPLGGLHSALVDASDGCWLIVPVDMPLLRQAHLIPLVKLMETSAAACYREHVLPMALRLDRHVRALIDALLAQASGGRSLLALHHRLHGSTIECPAELLDGLRNCNTPEQWQAICK